MITKLGRLAHTNTLRFKLVVIMIANVLIPILLLGSISYYSIYSILQNNIEKGVQSRMKEIVHTMQSSLDNLGYASRQLTLDGDIGGRLEQYMNPTLPNNMKSDIQSDIESRLTLISYANQGLGAMYYFIPEQKLNLFETMLIKKNVNPMDFPVLRSEPVTVYQGPHPSMYLYSDNMVFSIIQEMTGNKNLPKTYVYIETNFKVFRDLFPKDAFGFHVNYLITDGSHHILYSDMAKTYPVHSQLALTDNRASQVVSNQGQKLFAERGEGDWSIVAVVNKSDLSNEIISWSTRYTLIAIGSLAISLILAWMTWRIIHQKLHLLKNEIKMTADLQFDRPYVPMNIVEFDEVIDRFYLMRTRIRDLIIEVEEKEKNKRKLEVQKLKYQINPHFIHNTLNTIQWIARMHKQEEIVNLVSVFSRILHYNLGKEGDMVQIREEINALKDYVALQKIRYNHHFQVDFHIDPLAEELIIVRFLIQPLVENAMYHGFAEDDGQISVRVYKESTTFFIIEVEDNGQGMTLETKEKLLYANSDAQKSGLGIGFNFVNQTIREYFGEQHAVDIQSEIGKGTLIRIRLPILSRGKTE
ncbi:cache domain-containing sensor histidine kinase [Paenibacillus marchantiophytorum]|uniref:cache domain-containing sensor histidine kinase n=1 Tax=Paenibacillus marchantiophytorum TaxID=1619310 RepID=UPI00166A8807|nr:sensor histidine kinase [Paenibacillus marchantiophytorum]